LTVKSNDCKFLLDKLQTSREYNNIGKHALCGLWRGPLNKSTSITGSSPHSIESVYSRHFSVTWWPADLVLSRETFIIAEYCENH